MHPKAERILAHFHEKISTLNLENESTEVADTEEKRIADDMFELMRKRTMTNKDSGLSSDLSFTEDYVLTCDDWTEYSEIDNFWNHTTDPIHQEEETRQKAEKDQDVDHKAAEIESLQAKLARLGDTQYDVMKADMVMEREMKLYLSKCEAERREREVLLNNINEQRKRIYTLLAMLMPASQVLEQKTNSSVTSTASPVKTSSQAAQVEPEVKSVSNLTGARKAETTPGVVPAVAAAPAKTSTPSPITKNFHLGTNPTGVCNTETSRADTPALSVDSPASLDDADVESLFPWEFDDCFSTYHRPQSAPPQGAQPVQQRSAEHLLLEQPQRKPSEPALPTSPSSQWYHQYAQDAFHDPEGAHKRCGAPAIPYPHGAFASYPTPMVAPQPYSHYHSRYPSNGFGGQKPQVLSGASFAPYGSHYSLYPRDPAGQARFVTSSANAQNQHVQTLNPMYYGNVWYASQWANPYLRNPEFDN